ncbi:hypothetical protein [Acanthopleuribacter pedis]|uniref:Uncharacterized protein n=1 Tax=Acanthopleuribacter pedis TaxID=442870 RepID=A0A8J7QPW6_9BACT|nr:hypothetical protein [Acanthopleuribacter pedis]MBO1321955.1 hypothetical protein [Acanthopleuribacter pedis]
MTSIQGAGNLFNATALQYQTNSAAPATQPNQATADSQDSVELSAEALSLAAEPTSDEPNKPVPGDNPQPPDDI